MEQQVGGGSLEKSFSALTVDDVYDIAKLIGSDVEKLIDSFGKASVEGLVRKIVKVLEFLESSVAKNQVKCKEEEFLKAYETLQLQQQKRAAKPCEGAKDLEQELRRTSEELQAQVSQLQEEKLELLEQLKCSQSMGDHTQRQEREVMLKLKVVVDKQRDEIRAKAQETDRLSREAEALQEQLDRFMRMNAELRHKQSAAQAQVQSAMQRRADLEADLHEKEKEIERLAAQLAVAEQPIGLTKTEIDLTDKIIFDLKDPNRPCFTKQEVRDMIFERNELKANLFLVQEELSYYQREILNDERCPGFLLHAARSAMKKQRNVIKAKMLGITAEECSSDEEDKEPLFKGKEARTDTDCVDGRPPESRIRSLFGFLTRSSVGRSPNEQNKSSSWEIIGSDETELASEDRGRHLTAAPLSLH
ncbi:RILP-like protein 1 [Paramormyrops kingsleyae]|uniref:RILP-like protein 2 n=1 Tax=Paramormyrops kingsleyae TaxID=1676925 RepID=A0A3B3SIT0_9TELE|nr:RILP-like protein 1 isoform X2 [Paramormyrops kingsleyae]